MILLTPGKFKTSMFFGDLLQDHKKETFTSSIIKIDQHIQKKYDLITGYIEFDRQRQPNNFIAKAEVEETLNCTIIHVSTHAYFPELANKHVKTRVRAKLASLRYHVNRTILSCIVVPAINNLNLTTRSSNGDKSGRFMLTNEKINYRSYFAK